MNRDAVAGAVVRDVEPEAIVDEAQDVAGVPGVVRFPMAEDQRLVVLAPRPHPQVDAERLRPLEIPDVLSEHAAVVVVEV